MGVALHTQRVGGEQADYPVVTLEEALVIFNSFSWDEQIEAWSEVPDEEAEDRRPLFHLMDDAEHSLRITAYSRDLAGVAYDYPLRGPGTLAGPAVEGGYLGTDQFPLSSLRELFAVFFSSEQERVIALLSKCPTPAPRTNQEPQEGAAPAAAGAPSGER